jgi:hypothetical protein
MTHMQYSQRITPSELAAIRGRWQRWAAELRAEVAIMRPGERTALEHLADCLPGMPHVTLSGGPDFSWPPREAFRMASHHHIANVEYLNPWFLTADGWQSYRDALSALPGLAEACERINARNAKHPGETPATCTGESMEPTPGTGERSPGSGDPSPQIPKIIPRNQEFIPQKRGLVPNKRGLVHRDGSRTITAHVHR